MADVVIQPRVVIGGAFSLTDYNGRLVTDQSFRGRFALIFFGFTHCKVVCPTMLARISTALAALGSLAERIQPLYITVDPERDTPSVMKAFLTARFPKFLGLTGDKSAIDSMKRAYKVYAEKQFQDSTGDYDVPHTAMIFLVGPDGLYATHFADSVSEEQLTAGLRESVSGGSSYAKPTPS